MISHTNISTYLVPPPYQPVQHPFITQFWCFATILTLGNIKNPMPGVPRDRIDPYANTWPFTMSLNGVLRNLNLIGYQTIDCYESFMIFLR